MLTVWQGRGGLRKGRKGIKGEVSNEGPWDKEKGEGRRRIGQERDPVRRRCRGDWRPPQTWAGGKANGRRPTLRRQDHGPKRQQGPGLCSAPKLGSSGKEMGRGPTLYP